jgi:hypothetical protein
MRQYSKILLRDGINSLPSDKAILGLFYIIYRRTRENKALFSAYNNRINRLNEISSVLSTISLETENKLFSDIYNTELPFHYLISLLRIIDNYLNGGMTNDQLFLSIYTAFKKGSPCFQLLTEVGLTEKQIKALAEYPIIFYECYEVQPTLAISLEIAENIIDHFYIQY